MNYDLEEVNGSNPRMLRGSIRKSLGTRLGSGDQESTSPNRVGADMEVNSKVQVAPLCKYLLDKTTSLTVSGNSTLVLYNVQ